MPRFRHKPLEVDAALYTGPDDKYGLLQFANAKGKKIDLPAWVDEAQRKETGEHGSIALRGEDAVIYLHDIAMPLPVGAWLVRDHEGDMFVFAPEVFDMIYEAV